MKLKKACSRKISVLINVFFKKSPCPKMSSGTWSFVRVVLYWHGLSVHMYCFLCLPTVIRNKCTAATGPPHPFLSSNLIHLTRNSYQLFVLTFPINLLLLLPPPVHSLYLSVSPISFSPFLPHLIFPSIFLPILPHSLRPSPIQSLTLSLSPFLSQSLITFPIKSTISLSFFPLCISLLFLRPSYL